MTFATHFADRLNQKIQQTKSPLVVGLDPRFDQLPATLKVSVSSIEAPPKDKARITTEFCKGVIDVVASRVPAVKPQAAFFEQLGPLGMLALAEVVDYANAAGLIVIMDAKRGDIGSTAAAYADAFLGPKPTSAWGCDALTINPYLGDDSLTPFTDVATERGAGLFVLVKTSNPGSKTFQEQKINGLPLYSIVANHVQSLAAADLGQTGYGSVGAVIGATHPQQLTELRTSMPNTLFLVPGLGAQGGTAADVAGGFDENGFGAVINSSRAIIFAYEREQFSGAKSWQAAIEQATIETNQQIAEHTSAGKL